MQIHIIRALLLLAAATPAFGGYGFYRSITVNHLLVANTNLTDYPLMVAGTYSYLKTTGNGGNVTSASGYDIIFATDAAGLSPIAFERADYKATSGKVEFHIKVSSLSTSVDTTIYMLYGNAAVTTDQSAKTSVWDSNFKLVCHFGDGTTLDLTDSTSNGNNGTNHSGTAVAGLVGSGAVQFVAASTQYVDFGHATSLNLTTEATVEAFANAASLPGGGNFPQVVSKLSGNNGYEILLHDNSGRSANAFYIQFVNSGTFSVYPSDFGQLAIASTTIGLAGATTASGGGSAAFYTNGEFPAGSIYYSGPSSGAGTNATADLNVGRRQDGTFYFDGIIDEVRISNAARSGDWITTTYNNLSSPSTFYAISAASIVPGSIANTIGAQIQGQGSVY